MVAQGPADMIHTQPISENFHFERKVLRFYNIISKELISQMFQTILSPFPSIPSKLCFLSFPRSFLLLFLLFWSVQIHTSPYDILNSNWGHLFPNIHFLPYYPLHCYPPPRLTYQVGESYVTMLLCLFSGTDALGGRDTKVVSWASLCVRSASLCVRS